MVLLYLSPSFLHMVKMYIFFSIITISIKEGSSIFRNVDVQKQSYQEWQQERKVDIPYLLLTEQLS